MPPELPDFQQTQADFTAWLRHPEAQAVPTGVEARRMAIYRELLFNNVMTFVEATFPITGALLPAVLMERLKVTFFADYQCTSPFFYDISLHFRGFVAGLLEPEPTLDAGLDTTSADKAVHTYGADWNELADYPWLTELLHYEWMELAAEISEEPIPADCIALTAADFPLASDAALRLACPLWPLVYQWPVHQWSEDTTLADIGECPPAPVCILFFRPADASLLRIEITPVAAFLMETLAQQATTVEALATRLVQASPGLDLSAALKLTQEVLVHLHQRGLTFSH